MNRQQAKENLIGFGIAEPTDENITAYLNQIHGESQKEKDRADKFKSEADKVAELQSKLDELNNANLSEIEKANKATEQANNQVAQLTKQIAQMQLKNSLAEIGIVGDDATKLFAEDGSLDVSALGTIIKAREDASAIAKEQEIANGSTNPNGGRSGASANGDKPEKTSSEVIAESVGKALGGVSKASTDILSNYIKD